MYKKRAMTLMEIMIVILLITLIGGAIGYNVKGSLGKGKEFKTKQAKAQLEDILDLCLQEGMDPKEYARDPEKFLADSGLAKDPKNLLKDGNGRPFKVTYDRTKKHFVVKVQGDHTP